ncbi:MAG: hypothetical protein LBS85_03550, partial [Clostridiales Family XIII bacterium]|nr:hypothetical protein [Clostridiales Family XIII bacterium]
MLVLVLLSGCGGGGSGYAEGDSPSAVSVVLESYNEGTEDTQFALVTIAYDRDIAVKEGYVPKIRLADENVKKEEVTVSA